MSFPNKHPGKCATCGGIVPAFGGTYDRGKVYHEADSMFCKQTRAKLSQAQQEALDKAANGTSMTNYPAIFTGFGCAGRDRQVF
jgi:hypothetical protein